MTQETRVDASTYQRDLDNIADQIANVIERSWPVDRVHEAEAASILLANLRFARHYWRTEMYFAALNEKPEAGWSDEHSLVLPIIDRSLMEILFNTVFLIEDPAKRAIMFHQSGWRQAKLEHLRLDSEYGHSKATLWVTYLTEMSNMIETGAKLFKITAEKASNPASIPAWPPIGNMRRYGFSDRLLTNELPKQRQLLCHLYDWYYSELSSMAHGNAYAHLRMAGMAFAPHMNSEDRELLRLRIYPRHVSRSVFRGSAFLLAIVCEIQQYMQFHEGLIDARLQNIWEILRAQGEIDDIYKLRYQPIYSVHILGRSRLAD